MMKTLHLLSAALITLTALHTKAQDTQPAQAKSYFGFYGGLSKPVGDFGSADYYNNSSGLAQPSYTFSVNGAAYVYKNLAIGGMISYQDQGKPGQDDIQNLSAGYNTDFNAQATTVTVSNRYQSLHVLAGPQYSFLFGSLTLDLRVSAGMIKSFATPQYQVDVETETQISGTVPVTQNTTFYQNTSNRAAFAYAGSLGLRYSLSDGFGLAFLGNYVNSSGINISNENITFTTGRMVTKQPITELQATLGIFFQF